MCIYLLVYTIICYKVKDSRIVYYECSNDYCYETTLKLRGLQ